MLRLSGMSSRNEFGSLLSLATRGYIGKGVEIGTHRGDFAKILCDGWKDSVLYCVDHWAIPPGYEYQATMLPDASPTRVGDERKARQVLSEHIAANKAVMVKKSSNLAVLDFNDKSLDFVYLDGDHERPGIDNDLCMWWFKLKTGGLLAGHDIICPGGENNPHDWGKHIQPAVLPFAERQGVDVWLIAEEGNLPWSYFLVKN